ncbi:hypothetical protein B566_EDAN001864 [Ephemera danica]|nr:hypothetical protein B566_EDAN001864 [Ephemera danica]
MLSLFSAVSNIFKVSRSYDKVNIDNACAKLNYRITSVLLLVFTVVVCAQQYIGDMINCVQSGKSIPENVLNTYCFYFGTHTHKKKLEGVPFEHLIGPVSTNTAALRINSYYQWIPFYLFGLSMSFYFCHYIWKYLEGGNLKSILNGLRCMSYSCTEIAVGSIPSTKERQEKVEDLSNYLYIRIKSKLNYKWSSYLLVCEFFIFLHAVGICWLTDIFIGDKGNFWKIYSLEEFLTLFPTVSKCTFRKYGPSGGIQTHDALCLLNMNYIAGRVFFFLRWWFPLVAAISALAVLWRFVALCGFKFVGFNRLVNSSSHHNGKDQLKEFSDMLNPSIPMSDLGQV